MGQTNNATQHVLCLTSTSNYVAMLCVKASSSATVKVNGTSILGTLVLRFFFFSQTERALNRMISRGPIYESLDLNSLAWREDLDECEVFTNATVIDA